MTADVRSRTGSNLRSEPCQPRTTARSGGDRRREAAGRAL